MRGECKVKEWPRGIRCRDCGLMVEEWRHLARHVAQAHGRPLRGRREDGVVERPVEFPVPMYCRGCDQTFTRKDEMGECRTREGYHTVVPVR